MLDNVQEQLEQANDAAEQREITRRKHDKLLPNWAPGQSGNPAGRPKGSRQKLSEGFLSDLAEHWQEHGKDAISRACEKSPVEYLRVVASLMPKNVELSVDKGLASVLEAIDGNTRGLRAIDITPEDTDSE